MGSTLMIFSLFTSSVPKNDVGAPKRVGWTECMVVAPTKILGCDTPLKKLNLITPASTACASQRTPQGVETLVWKVQVWVENSVVTLSVTRDLGRGGNVKVCATGVMRLNFKFSNLFGTAYKSGGILFTLSGFGLLSPVGNQITVYDLKRDEALTLELNSFHNIRHIAISPSIGLAIAVNEIGEASILSLITGAVVSVYPFRHPISALSFSPDGKYVAVCKGHTIMMFFAPCLKRQVNHLELFRVFYGFNDDVTCISWSSDSSVFIAGSLDGTSRLFSVQRLRKLIVYTLSGHKNPIIGCFLFENSLDTVTISSDGDVRLWEASQALTELGSGDISEHKVLFHLQKRFRYCSSAGTNIQGMVTTTAFHNGLRLLATGFDSGLLILHSLPEFSIISEVKLFDSSISTLAINCVGDWIGVGCEDRGQIIVWEWRSQTCFLKAESHARQMTSLAYSPDGLHLATGGYDSKVKVWRVAGGRAVVTFTDHTAAVTGVAFPATKAKVVISSSLDGTVRAHDLVRYRNFRTLSVPTRQIQFSSVAVDALGTLVAAGGLDTFEAFVWSLKTGVLVAMLPGHTAPVSGLAFSPDVSGYGLEVASVSWDSTLRLWDLTGDSTDPNNPSAVGAIKETVNFSHDILCVAYRGDGKELALALLSGNIVFYDPVDGTEKGTIYGHHDLGVTQTTDEDLITPKRSAQARKFQTIAYSADGEHLLAAGDSKYICLYSIPDRVLIKRFEVTCNLSLEGVQEVFDRRRFLATHCPDSVAVKAIEMSSLPIPMNRKGADRSRRDWRPEIRVSSVQFSPTGDAFAATTTEGVLVYSLASAGTGYGLQSHFSLGRDSSDAWVFEAAGLDEQATPAAARLASSEGRHAEALDISIRLRLHDLVEEVIEAIPDRMIDFLAKQLPTNLVVLFMIPFLARQLGGRSKHVEFYVHWADALLRFHGMALRRGAATWALNALKSNQGQAKAQEREEDEEKRKEAELTKPGFLIERGEWAACQASLVRLQTSLQTIKNNVVERFESVDNLWHYLENLARLNSAVGAAQVTQVTDNSDNRTDAGTEMIRPSSNSEMVMDVDSEPPEIEQKKKKKKNPHPKSKDRSSKRLPGNASSSKNVAEEVECR
ncbi:unnamed protein product [Calicophoron daubneyi]|uniref:Small-subunit processome Utp12 domain-containing protein n=1 Tax=Calicophoron daubneyi TaxID=300641 RepID=A0AAV2T0B2_CALDB